MAWEIIKMDATYLLNAFHAFPLRAWSCQVLPAQKLPALFYDGRAAAVHVTS